MPTPIPFLPFHTPRTIFGGLAARLNATIAAAQPAVAARQGAVDGAQKAR